MFIYNDCFIVVKVVGMAKKRRISSLGRKKKESQFQAFNHSWASNTNAAYYIRAPLTKGYYEDVLECSSTYTVVFSSTLQCTNSLVGIEKEWVESNVICKILQILACGVCTLTFGQSL